MLSNRGDSSARGGFLVGARRFLSVPVLFFLVGTYLRLDQYLFNRSLWWDEAIWALQLSSRSFWKLLTSGSDITPVALAAPMRWITDVFGNSEYALRLIPLLAGLASMILMYRLASRLAGRTTALIALALFALSDALIYYATEAKPYATDVFFALVIALVCLRAMETAFSGASVAGLSALGACVWFSFPAVFVLAGAACALLLECARRPSRSAFARWFFCCAVWAASFYLLYVTSLQRLSANPVIVRFWDRWGVHIPDYSTWGPIVDWVRTCFFRLFGAADLVNGRAQPVGIRPLWLSVALFLIGGASLLRRRRNEFLVLLMPLGAVLGAAALRLYPFYERLILFLFPLLILAMAEGVAVVVRWAGRAAGGSVSGRRAVAGVCLALFFAAPVHQAIGGLLSPRTREEIKPALAYIGQHAQDTDVLYVYWTIRDSFLYYASRQPVAVPYVSGTVATRAPTFYRFDLDVKLAGYRRAWILLSHSLPRGTEEIVRFMDRKGRRVDSQRYPGVSLYLYDLAPGSPAEGRPRER